MTVPGPTEDFATMSGRDMAEHGLRAGSRVFLGLRRDGMLNGRALAVRLGVVEAGMFEEWGRATYGPRRSAAEFWKNIGPEDGKLRTVVRFLMNSGNAANLFGDQIPEGPQSWTGGVCYPAEVATRDRGVVRITFGGAGSGVQGAFDEATVTAALAALAGCWKLHMQAVHGKP